MLLLLLFLGVLQSDENVKVKEDGSFDWGSWALAMEVKRRVWTWDWDENVVKNFGFLLMEFKVLIINEFTIELGFCFLCSRFCQKCVWGFDYFYFQKPLLNLQRNFALGKDLGLLISSRFGPVLDISFGFIFL